MMYKEYKLKHFFMCVLVLLIGIGSFIGYAWRKNATAHIVDDGVDVYSPFYATPHTDNYHSNTDSGHGEKPESDEDHGNEHTTAPAHGGEKEHKEGH